MSTSEYLDSLTIDQLRYARDEADKRIKKAEESPKKIVWIVTNGNYNITWHREEDYSKAVESLIKAIQTDVHVEWAFEDAIKERCNSNVFSQNFPKIKLLWQNETEYEEWFK